MSSGDFTELVNQLSDRSYQIRQRAADHLSTLGPQAKAALPALRSRMSAEDDEDIRSSIVKAIASVEDDKSILIPELIRYLVDRRDYEVREAAAIALGLLGP